MSGRNELYDPPAGHNASSRNHDPAQTNQRVEEVKDILRQNVNLMAERGSRLDELQGQSENLSQNARGFNRRANQLRKDMWWKDMKMRICIIVGIVVLLIVIIAPSVYYGTKNKGS